MGVVHFDAHADVYDEIFGEKINNGTPFSRLLRKALSIPSAWSRSGSGPATTSAARLQFAVDAGIRTITMDEYENLGRKAVIEEIRRVVGEQPAYVTFDIDGLDPVFCPGTGVPEPGGLTMRDSQVMLRGLEGST